MNNKLIFRLHITGRYFGDCMVNGVNDKELSGKTKPTVCGWNDSEKSVIWDIDIESGTVLNWNGQVVDTHYKLVDDGYYELIYNGKVVSEADGYVPPFLGIEEDAFGDYVCLHINSDGTIRGWNENNTRNQIYEFFDVIDESFGFMRYDISMQTLVFSKSGKLKKVNEILKDFIND